MLHAATNLPEERTQFRNQKECYVKTPQPLYTRRKADMEVSYYKAIRRKNTERIKRDTNRHLGRSSFDEVLALGGCSVPNCDAVTRLEQRRGQSRAHGTQTQETETKTRRRHAQFRRRRGRRRRTERWAKEAKGGGGGGGDGDRNA